MRFKVVDIIYAISLAVVVVSAGCGYLGGPELEGELKPAPKIVLRDVFGRPFSLQEHLGKVIVVNFWASSCPPCIIEMPEFQAVHDKMGDEVVILSISPQDSESYIRDFIAKRGYTWLFASDPTASSAIDYGVTYFPTTVFIDIRGRKALTQIGGPVSRVFLETTIKKVYTLK